jgi:hypothetical protein
MHQMKKKSISLLLTTALLTVSPAALAQFQPSNTQTSPGAMTKPKTQLPIIPTGTTMEADLQQELSTGKIKNNGTFTLKIQNGSVSKYPILKDAIITGHVENVQKAARGKKAKLNLFFDEIKLKNGDRIELNAQLVNTKIQGKTKGTFLRNTGIILGGAIAGKFLGDKTKVKGGGLGGAAAATAFVLSSPGGEVVLKKGTDIELKLKSPINPN